MKYSAYRHLDFHGVPKRQLYIFICWNVIDVKAKGRHCKIICLLFSSCHRSKLCCYRLEHGGRYAVDKVAGFSICIHSLLHYVDCITDILKVLVPNFFSAIIQGWLCKPVQNGLIPLSNCESNTAVSKSFLGTYPQNEFWVRGQCGNKKSNRD